MLKQVGLHRKLATDECRPVEIVPIDVQTRFRDFDDYWLPFLGAQGSVSKYLRGLNDDTRSALRHQFQQQLPRTDDGEIPLMARAWAVKGKKGEKGIVE